MRPQMFFCSNSNIFLELILRRNGNIEFHGDGEESLYNFFFTFALSASMASSGAISDWSTVGGRVKGANDGTPPSDYG